MASGARRLIDGKRRHIRVVGQTTGDLHVFLAHRQYPVGRFAHDARHGGKWHLTRQHQDEGFEQQREAVEPSGKVRLNQAYRAAGQLHTRRTHLQVTLVLEEVQVPVVLGHRVVHRMRARMPRHFKAAACLEVNQNGQCLGRLIKVNRCHCPRWCDSKGGFEQLGSHHRFTHPG